MGADNEKLKESGRKNDIIQKENEKKDEEDVRLYSIKSIYKNNNQTKRMKAKSKKTLRSNSTKKLPIRNKSHPAHEFNLEKIFSQMKSDILNEMKKVAEIKFNEHKANILKILNRSKIGSKAKKKVQKPTKSEIKDKKAKIESDEDTIKYVGTEVLHPKPKDKIKKSKKRITPNTLRKNRTPAKVDNTTINLTEPSQSKSTATDPKLPKKGKIKRSYASDKNELLGNKRKRGKETFVNLTHNSEPKTSLKKKKVVNQPKKPSIKKKVK